MSADQPSARVDVLLAERVSQGNEPAEQELTAIYRPRILAMMMARTRNPEVARDLTQETLLALLQALRGGQLRDNQRLTAFAYGIARNVVNNHFRRRSNTPAEVPLLPEHAIADPIAEFEQEQRREMARRALEDLDALDREILRMTLVESAKPGEIAAKLGMNAEQVRTRKSRAIRKASEFIKKMSRK